MKKINITHIENPLFEDKKEYFTQADIDYMKEKTKAMQDPEFDINSVAHIDEMLYNYSTIHKNTSERIATLSIDDGTEHGIDIDYCEGSDSVEIYFHGSYNNTESVNIDKAIEAANLYVMALENIKEHMTKRFDGDNE